MLFGFSLPIYSYTPHYIKVWQILPKIVYFGTNISYILQNAFIALVLLWGQLIGYIMNLKFLSNYRFLHNSCIEYYGKMRGKNQWGNH
jgi:hypothetical protein